MPKDDLKVLCRRTQTRCDCGLNHYYYECGQHLLCLPDGATDIKFSGVSKGTTATIVGSKVTGTYKLAGSNTEYQIACEGIGETFSAPTPIEGVLETPIGMLCVRTQTKCTCDNQPGYMYDCGAKGMACLPISLASVQIASVAKTGKLCDAKRCNSGDGEEAIFTLIVRGSIRPRNDAEKSSKPRSSRAKATKAKGKPTPKAKTKSRSKTGRGSTRR